MRLEVASVPNSDLGVIFPARQARELGSFFSVCIYSQSVKPHWQIMIRRAERGQTVRESLRLCRLLKFSIPSIYTFVSTMVHELQDPNFSLKSRIVTCRSVWTVHVGVADVSDEVTIAETGTTATTTSHEVDGGVAGLVQRVLDTKKGLEEKIKVENPLDAMKAGSHSYYQAVLNNLKGELRDRDRTAKAEGKRAKGSQQAKASQKGPALVSVRRCAVRMAGGWGPDLHDRRCFAEACEKAAVEAYSDAQYGECK